MEILFPEYVSRIVPYHGIHFHTMELDKTMEIGFSNLFLQYFQDISILWKSSIFPVEPRNSFTAAQSSNQMRCLIFIFLGVRGANGA